MKEDTKKRLKISGILALIALIFFIIGISTIREEVDVLDDPTIVENEDENVDQMAQGREDF